ncbi:cytochrome b [Sphingomonas japonica]|uniref:Cytochrome b561 n=1 Tax=Sphingomonas japonica TaxID=511662 RepID=A0ABX0U073_9SPHN|nr:cytochrome b [Sphingomonas japonica]NIJ22676.1 cytochrome b561 [Sphingomonas japonica]
MTTAIDHQDAIQRRYTGGAIAFHWSIAVLVLVNVAIGLFGESLLAGIPNQMPVHKAIGITVLVLSIARTGWRIAHPAPPPPATLPGWQRLAARISHGAFYILLIALPLTGWLMVSGTEKRRELSWFGLFDIPYLPVGTAAGDAGHELHEMLGLLMAALIVLHVAAALRHHFVLRDGTLARMLPGAR